jgi:hypothetical protein
MVLVYVLHAECPTIASPVRMRNELRLRPDCNVLLAERALDERGMAEVCAVGYRSSHQLHTISLRVSWIARGSSLHRSVLDRARARDCALFCSDVAISGTRGARAAQLSRRQRSKDPNGKQGNPLADPWADRRARTTPLTRHRRDSPVPSSKRVFEHLICPSWTQETARGRARAPDPGPST